jgi:opacity protein-like surface antigen
MDRFDDIWRNRFNEGKAPEGEWGTPDDSVWEGISNHFQQEKRRKRILFFWLLSGLAALIILVALLSYGGKNQIQLVEPVQSVKEMNTTSTTAVTEEKENKVSLQSVLPSGITPVLTEEEIKQSENSEQTLPVSPGKQSATEVQIKINSAPSTNRGGFLLPVKDSLSTRESNTTGAVEQAADEEQLATNILTQNVRLATLDRLSTAEPPLLESDPAIDINIASKPTIGKTSNIHFSALAGASYLVHRISDHYTTDLSPFEFHYTDELGWMSGIQANIPVNRWLDVYTGFQYEALESSSGHNSDLVYNTSHENTGAHNGYDLSLATPYGLSDASFVLTRSNDVGQESLPVHVHFHSFHRIHNFSIPLGVNLYPLAKHKRLHPVIQLGMGFNYLSKLTNSIRSIQTDHEAITYTEASNTTFAESPIQRWHYDVRLGLGLNYRITPSVDVQLHYNWNQGLTPVFEKENYETRIDRHQLSIGLSRKF